MPMANRHTTLRGSVQLRGTERNLAELNRRRSRSAPVSGEAVRAEGEGAERLRRRAWGCSADAGRSGCFADLRASACGERS